MITTLELINDQASWLAPLRSPALTVSLRERGKMAADGRLWI